MSQSFCVVPWVQLSTKPNGNVRLCCLMTQAKDPDRGVLRRQDGTPYNAKDSDFLDAMNTEKAKSLRRDLLAGEKNPLCVSCWQKESVGLMSKRLVTNRDLKAFFDEDQARAITQEDGTVTNAPLLYLDLRFGNLCNLKCIMCHPASSSLWYNDYVELYGETEFTDTGDRVALELIGNQYQPQDRKAFSWYESPSFWQELDQRLAQVKQIYLVGGEPLLIKEHQKFLERCVEQGHAPAMTLEYDTNLTYLNPRILKLWSQFKRIKLRVSIESTGAQNDYIRFPSRWSEVSENIGLARAIGSNVDIDFSITWQIYNLFAVTQIWDQFPDLGSVRFLNTPEHLDIRILPRSFKERALQHLANYPSKSLRVSRQIESMAKYLTTHLDSENPRLLEEFRQFTRKCDKIRSTQVTATFPELREVFVGETLSLKTTYETCAERWSEGK